MQRIFKEFQKENEGIDPSYSNTATCSQSLDLVKNTR